MDKIGGGLDPQPYKDHRFYDFERTFGSAIAPDRFDFDEMKDVPNQNADGLPNGCSAYTVNEIASNEDKVYYDDYRFTYENTKMIAGVEGEVPVPLEKAFKAATVYGVKSQQLRADQANNRAPYFIIRPFANKNYFDAIKSAMWVKQGCIGLGTPWLPDFQRIGDDGIVHATVNPNMDFMNGHAWTVSGVKIIDGVEYLIAKTWQGKSYGDGGYCYFSREIINNLLSVRGSIALGQKDAKPEDIQTVKMDIIEVLISYWQRLLFIYKETIYA